MVSSCTRSKLFLAVMLLLSLVSIAALGGLMGACGSDAGADASSTAASSTTAGPITTVATGNDEASSTSVVSATATITDDLGRTVTVPTTINKVFCTSPIGTNLMYMLAPDKLAGWNFDLAAVEKEYILPQYHDLPNLGGWYGKNNTGNIEEIIKVAPDVILDIGMASDTTKSQDERIQEQLKIPVVHIDGSLVDSGATLRNVGKLLGVEERAEELAAYCDQVIAEARANTAKLQESDKVSVYYAEGNEGLNTDPSGSQHTEVLDLIGALNVAQVENAAGYGMAAVSLEQVLAWDPAVIFVASDPSQQTQVFKTVMSSADWASITAVKDKAVYQIPHGPFDWFDRPPCAARILGVRWVGNLLYPDLYQYDMKAEVKNFYSLFYQMELDDNQLAELTANAGVK